MQFDLMSQSQVTKLTLVPEKYPTNMADRFPSPPWAHDTGETHMRDVKQSFKWLLSAVVFAAYNISIRVWNKGTMTAYMRT